MALSETLNRISTIASPSLSPRSDEPQIAPSPTSSTNETLHELSAREFDGLKNWQPRGVDIEKVEIPVEGISKTDKGVTLYAIKVQLRGGLEWVITKRYSEVRGLHDRLKASCIFVKPLDFPGKLFIQNHNALVLEQRRRRLETYLRGLLHLQPLPRRELFNFLGVYSNVKEFERAQETTTHDPSYLNAESIDDVFNVVRKWSFEAYDERDSSSEDHFDTDPATPSVDSNDSQRQVPVSFPGRELSHLLLEELVEKCLHMGELQDACENVVERLLRTRNHLDEGPPSCIREEFARIAERFRAFLDQHADRSTVERLVSTRTLLNVLEEINCDLDSVQSKIGLDGGSWKESWDEVTRDVDDNLVSTWKTNAEGLHSELPTAETQRHALPLLVNEARQKQLRRSTSSQEIIDAATNLVAQMSDTTIEEVPERFIPEHEIQRDSFPFSSGSSGAVYHGKWRGAKVVVKYVDVKSSDDMRAFLQEDKIWHLARHPNVVTYYGACHFRSPCFFVSEEAVNGSAAEFIAAERMQGRLSMWRIMLEATLGLRFLHGINIIHGDLKCNNIVVDSNGVAKLTDFGMSFLNGSTSIPNTGPVRWAAPECLIHKQNPSFNSDKYSLGMCIIEAATGRVPWGIRRADVEVLDELAHSRFVPKPRELDDDQWSLITSMCSFDPKGRCTLSDAIKRLKNFARTEANGAREMM